MALDKPKGPERKSKSESLLARTLEYYKSEGIEVSAPPELTDNPGKTVAETLSDEALATRMGAAIEALDAEYAAFRNPQTPLSERATAITILEHALPRLTADIKYLRSIKRLPEIANFNPRKRYEI